MQTGLDETEVAFRTKEGVELGQLRLVDRGGASIRLLTPSESVERAEEQVQLLESRVYDFELKSPAGLHLEETSVVQPNRTNRDLGRIEPGLNTGLLTLTLLNSAETPVALAALEVRTHKIDYQTEYRAMLDDIGEFSAGLLMDFRGEAEARMSADPRLDVETLHQQFVVIRALLSSNDMSDAMDQLFGSPHRRWTAEELEVDPRRGIGSAHEIAQEIARGRVRMSLPPAHPLALRMKGLGVEQPSLPTRFRIERPSDTIDTPENRFVKFALEEFGSFVTRLEQTLLASPSPPGQRLLREVTPLRQKVATWLSHGMFIEIGDADSLPLGSPVLQRRAGYREVLKAWLTFQLATRLQWSGGRDVFGAGKRDVATLYEYWVFFKLLALVKDIFELDRGPSEQLIEASDDGLSLRLRSGESMSFSGTYHHGVRPLKVRFSYNRMYTRRTSTRSDISYPAEGSWTKPMRPDYSLSLWPAEFTVAEAERQELMVHVHFDAKYRVENLTALFGGDSEDEPRVEKDALRSGVAPKRADLLKMHAYRDAIRRTEGAYVLFPGSNPVESKDWLVFSEILPGLGAFALRPTAEATSIAVLGAFLREIADHVCSETTRLEQQTYHQFRIQEPSGDYRWRVDLPKTDVRGLRLRRRPQAEH
jgi:predicted component of viral defense system (DUF524 family)